MEVDSKDVEVKKKCCCFGARGDGIKMQWLLLFSLAIVYTVQIMRWKGEKNQKWQDVADLWVTRRSEFGLAGSALHISGRSWARSCLCVVLWRLRSSSHKEHGVGGAPATLWRCLPHPGPVAAWNWGCWPEGPGEKKGFVCKVYN